MLLSFCLDKKIAEDFIAEIRTLRAQLSQNKRAPFSVVSFCSLFYLNRKPKTQIKNFVLRSPP